MNTFGNIFKITISGESHSPEMNVMINGCPAGLDISAEDFKKDIDRRRPQSTGDTPRHEDDIPTILSGIADGKTLGSQINIRFENKNYRLEDYSFDGFFRPGHADYVAYKKYGKYISGGGQFSGRMTLLLVAAGTIAKKIIPECNIEAKLISAGGSTNIDEAITDVQTEKDSLGGIVECRINGVPCGFGEPFFNSIESEISHAMFSIPGLKAIEFGNGIESAKMKGSEYNDCIKNKDGETFTNNCGGINGGISNGNELVFRLFFHPTPSIAKPQMTYNFNSNKVEEFEIKGRHDVCFARRTPVIVEAMAAIVIADFKLIQESEK